MDIQPGTKVVISDDIIINNTVAFSRGEEVVVETVAPNAQKPEYRYVVTSAKLGSKFQLRAVDVVLPSAPPQPYRQPPVAPLSPPQAPTSKQKQKTGKAKWILLGASALILLIIIIAVATSGNKSEKTTTTGNNGTTATTQTTETKKDVYAVGETAKDGDLAITVYSFTPSPGDQFFTPEAGNQYIVVDLGIDNNGQKTAQISTMMEMSIKTPEGRKYDQAPYFPEPKYPDGAIQPGGKARGNVAFEVPASIGSMEFVFESLTGSPVRFKLQ